MYRVRLTLSSTILALVLCYSLVLIARVAVALPLAKAEAQQTCNPDCDYGISLRWNGDVSPRYSSAEQQRIVLDRFFISLAAEERERQALIDEQSRTTYMSLMRAYWNSTTPHQAAILESQWQERWSEPDFAATRRHGMRRALCFRGQFQDCDGRGGGHSSRQLSQEIEHPCHEWPPYWAGKDNSDVCARCPERMDCL